MIKVSRFKFVDDYGKPISLMHHENGEITITVDYSDFAVFRKHDVDRLVEWLQEVRADDNS